MKFKCIIVLKISLLLNLDFLSSRLTFLFFILNVIVFFFNLLTRKEKKGQTHSLFFLQYTNSCDYFHKILFSSPMNEIMSS